MILELFILFFLFFKWHIIDVLIDVFIELTQEDTLEEDFKIYV